MAGVLAAASEAYGEEFAAAAAHAGVWINGDPATLDSRGCSD